MQKLKWWFIYYNNLLLIKKNENGYSIPCSVDLPIELNEKSSIHKIGILDGYACKALQIHEEIEEKDGLLLIDLRSSYDYISQEQFSMAGKAYEILFWDKTSQYCPVCGTSTGIALPISKQCPSCNFEIFPTIATAILALVRKDDRILLVRSVNFTRPIHSLVAGFLETGESLEECVQREVLEETGLHVKNISYFGSQPWPFPSGLMVGFICDYESGEIKLQEEEIVCADFYAKDNLPELPGKLSLARKMIDWWIEDN